MATTFVWREYIRDICNWTIRPQEDKREHAPIREGTLQEFYTIASTKSRHKESKSDISGKVVSIQCQVGSPWKNHTLMSILDHILQLDHSSFVHICIVYGSAYISI